MRLSLPVRSGEAGRVALLAFLLFTNTLVLESNEVIATSGFVSNVGVDGILLVWAVVMLITMLTSSAYSLIVDRVDRARLGAMLFMGVSLVYLGFYFLFSAGVSDFISYGLLAVVTEQQWTMLPLVIWALGNDMFSTAVAKRIFPLLSAVVIVGGVAGNVIAAAMSRWLSDHSYSLLVFNGALLLMGAAAIFGALPRITGLNQQDHHGEGVRAMLREGLDFVRNVPAFRFLALIMVLMGFCLNTLQYQFLVDIARTYTDPAQLQLFYAAFKLASVPVMVLVQSLATPWLLNALGFKSVFAFMPATMALSLLLTLTWASPIGMLTLTGAIAGSYFTRVVLSAVDQPARQAFQGMVPDQRRGRVSALMEGFLYQGGSVASCVLVGGLLLAARAGWLPEALVRSLSIGSSLVASLLALALTYLLYQRYDESLLNWRLRRRQQGRSVLDQLKF